MPSAIVVAYRRRGTENWTHIFRVRGHEWKSFRRHARLWRQTFEYSIVVRGEYFPVI